MLTKTKNKIDLSPDELSYMRRLSRVVLAENSFWDYCKVIDGDFYRDDRSHLVTMCDTLNNLYNGTLLKDDGSPYRKIMINVPPRHGKTRTLIHFCEYVLGRNNQERIISCSYNDDTASDFSRYTRDGISKKKLDPNDIVFNDIFPKTKIKRDYSSFQKWALDGQHFNYLGAGIGGSITSKGASILILDDPVKGAIEAYNEKHLQKIWLWYTSTFLSRIEGDPIEIIVMTRWAKKDPCGMLLDDDEYKSNWYVLSLEAYNEKTDKMLCEEMLSRERYFYTRSKMDRPIFRANYHQEPISIEGALYKNFNVYDRLPTDSNGRKLFESIYSYTDTADTGSDFLCTIIFGVYLGKAYILDVYYSDQPMEITEKKCAELHSTHNVNMAVIESNAGGRGFARNVERIFFETFKRRLPIRHIINTQNKESRIYSQSAWVQDNIIMPVDWANRWPEFNVALLSYTRQGKNEHDDAPDALTGVAELLNNQPVAKAFENIF